ncbi:MAG: SPASM domain-containing protein [Proteobacteria bacterium]|nr:SPASM domain-containing protein [Pseudomonadota bacterium]
MISMLWYIKRELPRASIGWFTNGLLLSKRIITELAQIGTLERGIFNFGLHGGNSETYTQNTKVPWKDALEKLDLLVAVNTQLDTPFEIHVQMCDFSLTHDSIEDFRELCHQRGVQAHVCCFSNFGGLIHDEIGEAPFRDLEYMLCARSQTHIYVLWDGSVTTCCFDVNGVNTMGNVKEHTLREIWESDRYQTFRQLHCDGRFSEIPVCRDCNSNRFGG